MMNLGKFKKSFINVQFCLIKINGKRKIIDLLNIRDELSQYYYYSFFSVVNEASHSTLYQIKLN